MVQARFRPRPGLLALLTIALASGCRQKAPAPPAPRPGVAAQPNSLLPASTEELRQKLDARFRLGPDRRFLRALSDLEAIATGGEWRETSARWSNEHFELVRDGAVVGSITEFPDFPEWYAVLTSAATQALARGAVPLEDGAIAPASQPPVARPGRRRTRARARARATPTAPQPFLMQREALAAAGRVDRAWARGRHTRADLTSAADALASLAFQTADLMEVAERLDARALAVVALARAAGGPDPTRAEALVAEALGYPIAAERLAQGLPSGDPLRAFLQGDDEALERSLTALPSPATEYLSARWRAESGREDPRWKGVGSAPASLPVLALHLSARRANEDLAVSRAAMVLTLLDAGLEAGDPNARSLLSALERAPSPKAREALYARLGAGLRGPPGLFARFEAAVAKLPDGPLLSREARADASFASLDSALDVLARGSDDFRAIPELATPGATPRAQELRHLLETLAEPRPGRVVADRVLDELDTLKTLGATPWVRVLDEVTKSADWSDARLPAQLARIASGLDARPVNRLRLGDAAFTGLRDLRAAERLFRAGLEATHSPSHQLWLASFTGNWDALSSLSQAPRVPPALRAEAVKRLVASGRLPRVEAIARLRGLIGSRDPDAEVRLALSELLGAEGKHAEARAPLGEWLEHKLPDPGLHRPEMATALAREYFLEGDLARAWAAARPAAESWQGDAVRLAARILAAQGKGEEAETLARRLFKHSPGPKSGAVLAEVCWSLGRNSEAAAVLSAPGNVDDWRAIGDGFAQAFSNRPDDATFAALEPLLEAEVDPFGLSKIAFALAENGRHRLAFEVLSRLRHPSAETQLELSLMAYRALKRAGDEDAAREWLSKAVPPAMRNDRLGLRAYRAGTPELLWSLVATPERHDARGELVWLSRALASLDAPPLPPEKRKLLKEHFAAADGPPSHVVGRHLLGREPQSAVLAQVGADSKQACQTAYYLGLKAELERRLEDASDWFRVAGEVGSETDPERAWAVERREAWHRRNQSLAPIPAENPRGS